MIRTYSKIETLVGPIDWVLLREQKIALLEMARKAGADELAALEGIIHLLDAIQDAAAEDLGEAIVFPGLGEEEDNG